MSTETVTQTVSELKLTPPEFGKMVDQLTVMGRKEIAEAAGQSNRFLDRPVRAMRQGYRRRRRSGRAAPHDRGSRSRQEG
jgi:hypothetical protein